jgi:F-type H+-transporting ATPase subunit b
MRNWLVAALVGAVLAVAAAPVCAQNEHDKPKDKEADKAKDAGHGGHGGHDQKVAGVGKGLFVGAIETSLWTVVVFIILFFVLRRFAWGPIVAGLNKREQSIAQDKREAELARQEAASTRDKLAAEMARADAEVRAKLDKARADADALAADREAQSKATLVAERDRLHRELGIAEEQARKAIIDDAARLATLISAKTIKKHLTEADHRALVDEALHDFRAAAQKRKGDLESATT